LSARCTVVSNSDFCAPAARSPAEAVFPYAGGLPPPSPRLPASLNYSKISECSPILLCPTKKYHRNCLIGRATDKLDPDPSHACNHYGRDRSNLGAIPGVSSFSPAGSQGFLPTLHPAVKTSSSRTIRGLTPQLAVGRDWPVDFAWHLVDRSEIPTSRVAPGRLRRRFPFLELQSESPLRSMCRPRSPHRQRSARPGGRCKLRSIESWVPGR
jgi:hypothetical protein